ncbi:MAG TPA: tetratricopeptide repeat protein [Kofleriaceae bacterium]|nr:tetratricopeptide repeat protein [Kofleriaceae bacterium]
MWSGYSTRDAAHLAGLTESAVRSCARAGLLSETAGGLPARLSFQDLAVLKSIKELARGGVSWRRIRRELLELRRRAPSGLSSLHLSASGRHVVVREGSCAWQADSGQILLDFGLAQPGGEVAAMPIRREAPAPQPAPGLSADQWFDRGTDLEEEDAGAAIEAYRHALHLRPDCTETLINLGRLYAENGAVQQAAESFSRAMELDPRDATAVYNLGVVAQDMGRDGEAIQLYERALGLDPALAEAHYNLATIFDRTGDPRAAIRHIHEYRKLTRD